LIESIRTTLAPSIGTPLSMFRIGLDRGLFQGGQTQ
jgi:hypothetical protein